MDLAISTTGFVLIVARLINIHPPSQSWRFKEGMSSSYSQWVKKVQRDNSPFSPQVQTWWLVCLYKAWASCLPQQLSDTGLTSISISLIITTYFMVRMCFHKLSCCLWIHMLVVAERVGNNVLIGGQIFTWSVVMSSLPGNVCSCPVMRRAASHNRARWRKTGNHWITSE